MLECEDLKKKIEGGAKFADMAREHSQCPSGKQGGDLGQFSPGQMVKEFDTVVFSAEVGKVHGPVKTQFGFHLIEITDRR
ncbi:MAG: peptidyl-prolyl cis-trans isomerase C [Elusimicrobia bacterium]|nr:MAG: peptidyl-prolyl cis-trans isomerase C [Elusimicrobiota bacterium]